MFGRGMSLMRGVERVNQCTCNSRTSAVLMVCRISWDLLALSMLVTRRN